MPWSGPPVRVGNQPIMITDKFKQFEINNQDQIKAGYYIVSYLAHDGEGNTVADFKGMGSDTGDVICDIQDRSSWGWTVGERPG